MNREKIWGVVKMFLFGILVVIIMGLLTPRGWADGNDINQRKILCVL